MDQEVTATSGEQIADAAGLPVRTLWRYFRSKERCVEPVVARSLDAFLATVRSCPPDRSRGVLPDRNVDHRGQAPITSTAPQPCLMPAYPLMGQG